MRTAVRGTVYALLATATLGYLAGGLWVLSWVWGVPQ